MRILILLILATSTLAGCSSKPKVSLYQQINGNAGITKLVDSFIRQIGHDRQVFHYFEHSNITHFRQGFISHLCTLTNGPCEYSGDSMIDIHTGMQINEKDFNHVVELLIKAMDEQNIPHPLQNKILSRMAPLRSEIIKI